MNLKICSRLHFLSVFFSAIATRNAHVLVQNITMKNLQNWVTWHKTPAHWCVTTVFKPHWALVLHQRFSLLLPLFFNTKIHESLAPGVTVWWIQFLLLPQHRLKSPLLGWISLTEGLVYSRSYTTEPRKVKLIGKMFQLCAWEMFPAISWNYFYFSSFFPPTTYVSQWEKSQTEECILVYPLVLCATLEFMDTV